MLLMSYFFASLFIFNKGFWKQGFKMKQSKKEYFAALSFSLCQFYESVEKELSHMNRINLWPAMTVIINWEEEKKEGLWINKYYLKKC